MEFAGKFIISCVNPREVTLRPISLEEVGLDQSRRPRRLRP